MLPPAAMEKIEMAKVAYDPFGSYLTQPSVITVAPPTVTLAAASDSGTLGDQVTAYKNVRLEVSGLRSSSFAWLSKDGNSTLDAVDIPVINGAVNVSLSAGYNTFTFYQQDIPTGQLSLPSYYAVYLDPAAAAQQAQAFEASLNKMALAYLGRPLTTQEYQTYSAILEGGGGDTTTLATTLASHPEFYAVYTVPDLKTGIERCYSMLFGRTATSSEVSQWSARIADGSLSVLSLPRAIAESATGSDTGVLAARVLFMQQANADFADNLAASGVAERTLLEVERTALQGIASHGDIASSYESIVANASSLKTTPGSLPAPSVSLDTASDDGTKGDSVTSLQTVKINVSGTTPGSLAWLDNNFNGQFDPSTDSPVINGSVYANLNFGANALSFYQQINNVVSAPSYLTVRRADANTPINPPAAPVLDLRTEDDDGVNNSDNVTTKSIVRIDVSNLDPTSSFAWVEKDGNGVYNSGTDVALQVGGTTATATVQLLEAGLGSNITGLSVHQVRAGLASAAGHLSVTYLKSVDVVKITSGSGAFGNDSVISLQFDRPVDWARLDTNSDGYLSLGKPGASGVELGVTLAGSKLNIGIPADWKIKVPSYWSTFLTLTDVDISFRQDPNSTTDPKKYFDSGDLLVLLTGVPDLSAGVFSDASISLPIK